MKASAALRKEADAGDCWKGFRPGDWTTSINVRDFIVRNVTPYTGTRTFWRGHRSAQKPSGRNCSRISRTKERRACLRSMHKTPSTLLAHKAGYIDRENEVIVGLQTDQPFKRAIFPFGGLRMVEAGLKAAGFEPDPAVHETFTKYRKSHNDGVFDAYTPEIMNCRRSGIITGLPDAYGRGRIIGDYRRVALYGIDRLLEAKRAERAQIDDMWPTDEIIRQREELSEQMRALQDLASMAKLYGHDISKPASNAQEAFQWTYFAYLGAIKEANGAAMSIGRISTFLDIYIERDLKDGVLDEARAQELWDQLVQKLRIVRFLRTPDYDALFSGDPYWATECVGGMDLDGRALVTKSSYRMLHTLSNLGPAPEPNITVLWSNQMPAAFKRYCVKVSRDTSSLQYENDDLMRPFWGDDYGIACCVSAMRLGKQMQFFGARVNLAKALLYAINGGRDEVSGEQVAPETLPVTGEFLDYDEVMAKFDTTMEWLARTYVHAMNCIHYMHDKYFYERLEMALHDRDILRTMAFGIAGLSVVADSLSAIKYGKIRAHARCRPDWSSTIKTSGTPRHPSSATTTIASIKSRRTSSQASWRRYANTRPIETRHTRKACSPSRRTSCTARPRETLPMAAERASRSDRAPIRCTAGTATAGSRRACPSQSFPTRTRRTVSATPSPSLRRRRICPKASFWTRLSRPSTSISIGAAST